MSTEFEDQSASTTDRRQNARRAVVAQVKMSLDQPQIEGVTDNISRVGLLFFSQEPVRVTVEVVEEDGVKTYAGRLVRAQRMKETSTGFAIEFDPE